MQLTVRLLGVEFLHVELCESVDAEPDGSGHTGGTIVGFTPSPHDQRWERGVEFE